MKRILCSLLGLGALYAQPTQRCGHLDVISRAEQLAPGYEAALKATYSEALAHSKSQSSQKSGEVYRIPVVVHIVYLNAQQNIPDGLIQDQIRVLNEDFRRRNADSSLTRDVFKSVAADTRIEFFLADTDPNGNPTSGITRTQGTPAFGTFDPFTESIKSSSAGGVDPWPVENYLNIWVGDLVFGFGILGYATPPVGAPNWPSDAIPTDPNVQGVVIHHAVFGPGNPNAGDALAIVNKGRTLTHEVGHYLGLRHIWGDGDCSEDDGLADTPLSDDSANQICNFSRNSCVDAGAVDWPDMIENYMDYAADSCMNLFTEGQAALMRSNLQLYRQNLYVLSPVSVESYGIEAVQVFPNPAREGAYYSLNRTLVASADVFLYSIHGQELRSFRLEAGQSHLYMDLSGIPSGVYILRNSVLGRDVSRIVVMD